MDVSSTKTGRKRSTVTAICWIDSWYCQLRKCQPGQGGFCSWIVDFGDLDDPGYSGEISMTFNQILYSSVLSQSSFSRKIMETICESTRNLQTPKYSLETTRMMLLTPLSQVSNSTCDVRNCRRGRQNGSTLPHWR